MTTTLQRSQAGDKAANMGITAREISVSFLLTIILSGRVASVPPEDCFPGSSVLLPEPSSVSVSQAAGLLPPLFEDDIYFSSVNVLESLEDKCWLCFHGAKCMY